MFAVNDEEGSAGFLPSRQANEQASRGFTRWHGQFQLYFGFSRIPTCIGLLESVLSAIVNRSRACPPQADLSAIILARRFCGGLEGLPAVILAGWPADHLMAASFTGGRIQGLK